MNCTAAFINPDDEVLMIEPAFEYYYEQNSVFGGKSRYYAMSPPSENNSQWSINFKELRKMFNDKTKMLILNTPHNPTGKMLTEAEIQEFIAILRDFPRVIVLSDEVPFHNHYILMKLIGL